MESQRGFLDIVPHPKALSALAPHPLSLVCRVSCVGAEVVISGEERRGEEGRREKGSRWGERARSPNEVSLVALGAKKTQLSPPPLSQP